MVSSSPVKLINPLSGSTIPAMDLRVMLFPQPDGPRIPKRLFFNSKSTQFEINIQVKFIKLFLDIYFQ
ncbi:hypothetical protein [uncultured Methanobrevibacter sp.]|uniref:hypothetical protein n=1 Tax=uncultured Methanobrevibacter sp. TaxID=253161 RepID=UPI0025E2DEA4|nr:hypothetical protein [uncultured Methanobrevibacter sp.]